MKKLILAILFLSGCGAARYQKMAENHRKDMENWSGKDINQLIQSRGAPTNTFKMPNGNIMYTWLKKDRERNVPNYDSDGKITDIRSVVFECKDTFTTDEKGTIIQFMFDGNACK